MEKRYTVPKEVTGTETASDPTRQMGRATRRPEDTNVIYAKDVPTSERTPLTLGAFHPEKGRETMTKYVLENRLIPENNLVINALAQAAKVRGEDYFFEERGMRLMDKANDEAYTAIQERFGLESPTAAATFFEDQMVEANEQVGNLIDFFDLGNTLGLRNEVEIAPSPAELICLLHSQDPRTRYETARQVSLAAIAAELSDHKLAAEKRLLEVQKCFSRDLFSRREIKEETFYALHDNDTNEVKWDSGSGETMPVVDMEETHLKGHDHTMRVIQGTDLGVVQIIRRKKGAVIKALKKALERAEKDEHDDTLKPLTDVTDMIGMKFTVDGTSEEVDMLMSRVQNILTTRFKDQLAEEGAFKRKDTTRGAATQSGKFQAKRLMVEFKDIKFPLELMFHTKREEVENNFDIGEFNQETGRYTGAAHPFMEVDRAIELAQALFPAEIYGQINWEELRQQKHEEAAMALRQRKRVEPMTASVIIDGFAKQARRRDLLL